MAARQFWRANGKRARRSSGVIQTRSTRRHEAVNISGAARERRNKSVKRDKEEEEEEDGGNASGEQGWKDRAGADSDTMKRGKVVDARESAASHCEPSSTLPFPYPAPSTSFSSSSYCRSCRNVLFRDATRLRDK